MLVSACNVSSPVSRRIGAQCESHDECDDMCLQAPEYPDGFCSVSCDDSRDCPGSSVCVAANQGVCLFTCTDAADCGFLGPNWICDRRTGADGGGVDVCVGQP